MLSKLRFEIRRQVKTSTATNYKIFDHCRTAQVQTCIHYSLDTEILLDDGLQFQHEICELRESLDVLQQWTVSCRRVTTATETDPHHK